METVFLLITTFSIVSSSSIASIPQFPQFCTKFPDFLFCDVIQTTERRPSIEESKNLTPNCLVMVPTHEIMKYGMATLSPVLYVSMFVSQSYLCNQ